MAANQHQVLAISNALHLALNAMSYEEASELEAEIIAEYESLLQANEALGVLLDTLREQYQTALDRLWEAHDQLCGCDRPAYAGTCSAPQETWGAFEYLGERERDSFPTSGERVATGEPSRTSAQGAKQSPEGSSPAKRPT